MKTSDLLASIGVIILLIAFLLNLYKKLSSESKIYSLLNFIGAGICGYSSYLISFYPFIVLESIWAAVALGSLLRVPRGTSENNK
jgi:cytochrome bd-type quinol oxidase subunit 2